MTTGLSAAEFRSLARFRRALRVFLRFSEDAARAAGLTPNQHQLLLAVKGADGPPSIAEVADALQLKHHSVVELVQRAEHGRLVSVAPDPDDHRRHLLRLTPLGDSRLAALSLLHRTELRRFRTEMNDILQELG